MLLYEEIVACAQGPLVDEAEKEPAPGAAAQKSGGHRAARILIIESDPASLEALREMCAVLGYACDEANSVAEGLAQMERARPRCVLLALMLPDGSGLKILRQVREKYLPVKVAVLFGSAEPRQLLDEVSELRADGLFLRPLNIPAIASWLWLANN